MAQAERRQLPHYSQQVLLRFCLLLRFGQGHKGATAISPAELYLQQQMRRALTIVAILSLLTSAAPVLACVTAQSITPAQRACCRAMHDQCGQMRQTGCCQTVTREVAPQFATISPQLNIHWSMSVVSAHLAPAMTKSLTSLRLHLESSQEHPPPGLVLATSSLLRI